VVRVFAAVVGAGVVLVAGCGIVSERGRPPPSPAQEPSAPNVVPRAEPKSRYGNPASYVVNGKRYYTLSSSHGYVERGIASWYGQEFHGRRTSSGEVYDMHTMTAAHKTLPLPTYVKVRELRTGRSVIVRVNDRGPFHPNRIIDLSYAAARKLGIVRDGTGLVEVRAIEPGPRRAARHGSGRYVDAAPPVRMFLQVGAFASRSNADRLRERVRALAGNAVRVTRVDRRGQDLYRVRIGPIIDVDEADRLAKRMVDLGLDAPRVVIE